jgi:hypothetical protein
MKQVNIFIGVHSVRQKNVLFFIAPGLNFGSIKQANIFTGLDPQRGIPFVCLRISFTKHRSVKCGTERQTFSVLSEESELQFQ